MNNGLGFIYFLFLLFLFSNFSFILFLAFILLFFILDLGKGCNVTVTQFHNAKSKILIDYIHAEPLEITIVTNKVS